MDDGAVELRNRRAPALQMTFWHRIAHIFGCNLVRVVDKDAGGWIIRECATCGKRYAPAPPCYPL